MKIELTERDKKLLTFMGVFVLVALIGYYGVLPQIKKANELQDEIEEQESLQMIYESKVAQLFFVEENNKVLEGLIEGAKENYYPMMDSDEIDNLVTNTVIEKYNLISYDLIIGERSLAGLQPYIYSKKALTGESDARERAMQSAAPIIGEDGILLFADIDVSESFSSEGYDDDILATGVYVVPIKMRLSGDMKKIYQFLDDLALSEKKIRLVNYNVDTEEIVINHDDGTEEIVMTDYLNVSFELYMCAD